MREMRRMKKNIFHLLFTALLLAAVWSVPSYADEDPVELDLAKGDVVITNAGYSHGGGKIVPHQGSYVITSSSSEPVAHTITIESELADVTLRDVLAATADTSPLSLGGSLDHAMLRLQLDGTNVLQCTKGNYAGIFVPEGALLVIEDSMGSLSVTGSGTAAGIGGGSREEPLPGIVSENCGSITIHGGIITVTGGTAGGSGIGGAVGGRGGSIEITGGSLVISPGADGTGMGSSSKWADKQNGGSIEITGGTVSISGSLGAEGDVLLGVEDGAPWVVAEQMGARINGFSGVLFQGTEGRFYGNRTYVLERDRTILTGKTLLADAKTTVEIREGACLTINGTFENEGSLRLASENCIKQGKEGRLGGRGKFTVPGITADMISVPSNLVYDSTEGEDITGTVLEQIQLDRKKRGRKELFGVEFTVIPDFTGWDTKEIDWPVLEPGEYTVTFSKGGEQPLKKRFMVYSPGEAVRSGLASIEVFQKPFKMTYSYGDSFDSTDMIVVGTYEDGSIRNVTSLVNVEWETFDLGVHAVKITCARDEERQELSCLLEGIVIVAKEIDVSDLYWNVEEFVYDGMEKTITLEGRMPEGVIADRKTSVGKDAGTYTAEVHFSLSGSMDQEHYVIVGPNPLRAEWTINPKELTWETGGLSAAGQAGESRERKISLYGTLEAMGVLSEDREEVVSQWPAARLDGFYEGTEAGEQEIALSWKGGFEPSVGSNYCLPKEMPVVLGVIHDVRSLSEPKELSEDGRTYRAEMEIGISQVPEGLAEDPRLSRPQGIETRMRRAVTEQDPAVLITNTAVYDINLLVLLQGDVWEKLETDAFPEGGVTMTLPYPGKTNGNDYEFTIAHMYTEKRGSHSAGDVEYLAVTKTPEGLQFKTASLSPVSIGWRLTTDRAPGEDTDASGLSSEELATLILCIVLAVLAVAAVAVILKFGILPKLKEKEDDFKP